MKAVGGDTTTLTLYSGNDIVYEVRTQAGQVPVTTKYLAVNGKYLAKVVQEGTNPLQTYFYHVDLVGSVRAITDSQGQVVGRFEYEPFGVTSASGPLGSRPEAGGEIHKFTGKPEDAAIGLYYFNARYYDPLVGRFVSEDSKQAGLNWYEYARSNRCGIRTLTVVGLQACQVRAWLGPGIGRHFDTDRSNLDSRLYAADYALRTAHEYLDNGVRISALRYIGFGLHAVGDVSAHANWNPYPINKHPDQYNDPRFDFDWNGAKQRGSGAPREFIPGSKRYKQFLEDTRAYLERAYDLMYPRMGRAHRGIVLC